MIRQAIRGLVALTAMILLLDTATGQPGGISDKFRKELALLHEAKGASLTDPKAANREWGLAIKEWNTLFRVASNQLQKANPEQEKQLKSNVFDAYFEIQRCVLQANTQILKGNPKLEQTFTVVGKRMFEMETNNKLAEQEKKGAGIISSEVWTRYCDLLDQYPDLKNAYKTAGGKFFLERPKE